MLEKQKQLRWAGIFIGRTISLAKNGFPESAVTRAQQRLRAVTETKQAEWLWRDLREI